jgi:hypothetical protein
MNALNSQVGGNHYKQLAIQPVEYITKNNLGWCEGNIIKYITRHQCKGQASDLDKVIHYAQLAKELYYSDEYYSDDNGPLISGPSSEKMDQSGEEDAWRNLDQVRYTDEGQPPVQGRGIYRGIL